MTSRPQRTRYIRIRTIIVRACVRLFALDYPFVLIACVLLSLCSKKVLELRRKCTTLTLLRSRRRCRLKERKKEIGEQTEELSFSIQRSFTPFFNENMVCMTRSIGYKAD